MAFFPNIEWEPKSEIKRFQEDQLRRNIDYCVQNSRLYQDVFFRNHLKIGDIKTLEDLAKIPVTNKEDLFLRNEEFVCVPKSKNIDYITNYGTLGDPVTFSMTDHDLDRLAYNECMSFKTCGRSK